MFVIDTLIILFFMTNLIRIASSISMRELTTNDIIIDVNKGYALRHVGTYSSNIIEQIVHTFIPLNDFCMVSPKTDVCVYTSFSAKTNIVQLATTMTSSQLNGPLSTYDSNYISRLVGQDISRVLAKHPPVQSFRGAKSIIHFLKDQFYYQKNDTKALEAASSVNGVNDSDDIARFRPTPVELILKQINNNKISFEYLSYNDLKFFLRTIFSNMDISYTMSDVQQSLNIFSERIVGQSIFALRHCALNRQSSLPSQPCLAISTLFLRIPSDSISAYFVYQLIPLPVVLHNSKYVYSNLPKIIGINSMAQTLITWTDKSDSSGCIFSSIVLCRNKPVSMSLTKSTCLSQLFDDNQSVASMCQVSRIQNTEPDIMQVVDGTWLFYNMSQTHHCQVHSTFNALAETISISEAAIVRIPCDKIVTCTDFQLTASACKQHRLTIISGSNLNIQNLSHFILPIRNMSQTLVSAYQFQSDQLLQDLTTSISKQWRFKQLIRDLATYLLSVLFLILVTIFLYIFKLIKYKLQKEISNLEYMVEEMIGV